MDRATRHKLLEIGRRFYDVHSGSFDQTRRHPWPGWDRVLPHLDMDADGDARAPLCVLDVGCGNGRFAEHLARRVARPETVHYLGLDVSAPLLEAARSTLEDVAEGAALEEAALEEAALEDAALEDAALEDAGPALGRVELRRADAFDLLDPETAPGPFDLVALFGVLHHLPGEEARRRLLGSLARRLAPGGVLAVTIWRLDRDEERFERLRIPWEAWNEGAPAELRLDPDTLEPGDALLGWRGETETPRYVHFPTDEEIDALERRVADTPGMEPIDRFLADGPASDPPERGDNLYLVFRRAAE